MFAVLIDCFKPVPAFALASAIILLSRDMWDRQQLMLMMTMPFAMIWSCISMVTPTLAAVHCITPFSFVFQLAIVIVIVTKPRSHVSQNCLLATKSVCWNACLVSAQSLPIPLPDTVSLQL
jgi:hypothetical protein